MGQRYVAATLFTILLILLTYGVVGVSMAVVEATGLFLLWWFVWRPGMTEWYHDWRFMRVQKKRLNEIKSLEDLFKE